MKEATGELSMTAIVVVILGVLAVLAPIIIRSVGNTMKMRAACQAAYGCGTCESGKRSCKYVQDNGTPDDIECSCNNENDVNN